MQKASLFIGTLRPAGVWPGLGCAEGPGHKHRQQVWSYTVGLYTSSGAEGQSFLLDKCTDSLTSVSMILESTVTFSLLERRQEGGDIEFSLSSLSPSFPALQPV